MLEAQRPATRARKGTGSIRQVRPGVWKPAPTALAGIAGGSRRVHRVVHVRTAREATDELATFVAEVRALGRPSPEVASLCFDEAVERFLTEHLRDEKSRVRWSTRSVVDPEEGGQKCTIDEGSVSTVIDTEVCASRPSCELRTSRGRFEYVGFQLRATLASVTRH